MTSSTAGTRSSVTLLSHFTVTIEHAVVFVSHHRGYFTCADRTRSYDESARRSFGAHSSTDHRGGTDEIIGVEASLALLIGMVRTWEHSCHRRQDEPEVTRRGVCRCGI